MPKTRNLDKKKRQDQAHYNLQQSRTSGGHGIAIKKPVINGIVNCKLERLEEKKRGAASQEQVDSVANVHALWKTQNADKAKAFAVHS